MKKLNATNAIAILSLGLTLSVVVAGCGGGNDTAESAVTKNAKPEKAGTTDGGAGGDSSKPEKAGTTDDGAGNGTTKSAPTTIAKTGSADGGTGESVTVSDSVFQYCDFNPELSSQTPSGATPDSVCKESVASLTNSQMNALTSAQWEKVDGYLSASQVESIPTKTIKNLTTTFLDGLSAAGTQALTTEQLNSMSKDQLNELVSSDELTDTQLVTVNTRLKKLG